MKEFMIAIVKTITALMKEIYKDLFDRNKNQIKP